MSAKGRHLNVRGFAVDTLYHMGFSFAEDVPISGAQKKTAHKGKSITEMWTIARVQQWYKLAMQYAKMYENQDKHSEAYLYTLVAGYLAIDPDSLVFLRRSYGLWCKVWLFAAANDLSTALWAYGQHATHDINEAMHFMQMHVNAAWGRKIFTSRGYGVMGLCPTLARKGDMLVIIHGVNTPCVLRRCRNGKHCFIGQCYAHGLMHGEAKEIFAHCEVTQFELV